MDKEHFEHREKIRKHLAIAYNQPYRSFDELYGRSNDDAGDLGDGENIEFPPINTGTRDPLPYVPPTEFDPETGSFPGLEPPVA